MMKGLLILVVAFVAATNAMTDKEFAQQQWQYFKKLHNKVYENDVEDQMKKQVFMKNTIKMMEHNLKYHRGEVSFKLDANKFGDMHHHEVVGLLNGFDRNLSKNLKGSRHENAVYIPPANAKVPESIDWREKGAVTPVKDQGHCGSCWAFSTTGSLEGQHFRQTGVLVSLSEQNLIDCSTKYGNNGCNGGLMDNAFRYIKDNGGIDTEKTYPYEGHNDSCRYTPKNSGAEDVGLTDVPEGDEEKLKNAVANVGPISVAIDASQETFQFYSEGVYDEPQCSSENLDHGVLVVGYGTDPRGGDYWLVKNSWGTSWGDNGYIKMARNKNNQCGIASSASYPLV